MRPPGSLIDEEASPSGGASPAAPGAAPSVFDFRRPSKFAREHVRSLENLHESFTRRFATSLSHALRAAVQLRPVAVDELTYESYLRSLPNPSALTLVSLRPLPGEAILEVASPLALVLVDRALGGLGTPAPLRRLSDLETALLAEVMRYGIAAFAEVFAPVLSVEPEVVGVETNPSFVQVAPPSETTLLLSFACTISATNAIEGLLTLCYPYPLLQPVMDRLQRPIAVEQMAQAESPQDRSAEVASHLADAIVPLAVCLNPTPVAAQEIFALSPGDVLRLAHRVDEPVRVLVEGVDVLDGFLGRRGRHMAVRLTRWQTEGS